MAPRDTLPPDLDTFLRPRTYAMLTLGSSIGTVIVIKAPSKDIDTCRGRRKIEISYELYEYPGGPVLRMILRILDKSGPLVMETFCNADQNDQRDDWRSLLAADTLRLVFFDEAHTCRLSKLITQPPDPTRAKLIPTALGILVRTDPGARDFDGAKAACMAANPI